MVKLKCVIVDDELHAVNTLVDYLADFDNVQVIKTFTSSLQAVNYIASSRDMIDILFLDVDMPEMNGLELAKSVRSKISQLVFVTGHPGYSLEAFDVLCNQYLLKPFSKMQLATVFSRLTQNNPILQSSDAGFIFLKSMSLSGLTKVSLDEIVLVEALEHYVVVYTMNDKFIQHGSMKEIEKKLSLTNLFLRIHKSHILSKSYISSINGNTVCMANNKQITVGTTFRSYFQKFLNDHSLK